MKSVLKGNFPSDPMNANRKSISLAVGLFASLAGMLSLHAAEWKQEAQGILHGSAVVIQNPGKGVSLSQETTLNEGAVLRFSSDEEFSEKNFTVGEFVKLKEFAATFRKISSCWMYTNVGQRTSEIPRETQFLLTKDEGGVYTILIPLVKDAFRNSLIGSADNRLTLISESGDSQTSTSQVDGLYLIRGADPYAMMHTAALEIGKVLGMPDMGTNFKRPPFNDYLGWCTWDAFYQEVSAEKIEAGLKEYIDGGTRLGYVIIDDGWQQHTDKELTGFDAVPKKFPKGLGNFVGKMKNEYDLQQVIVWQTLWGYWKGTSPDAFPNLGVEPLKSNIAPRHRRKKDGGKALNVEAEILARFYPYNILDKPINFPDFEKFYGKYHASLKAQNVDGVKIDAMAWAEIFAEGKGGRVKRVKEMIDAMKHSTTEIFGNDSIYCSALSNDFILQAGRNSVTRNSTDFRPARPETHGDHIFINAHCSFWIGEFVIPDWDMFQSGHESGAFHAAARSIAGGPVYVSDKLKEHNFTVLKKLSLSDGRIPQSKSWAKPTLDSFFIHPTKDRKPIKIFNVNKYNSVVGAFNCNYDYQQPISVRGTVSPSDVPNSKGELFAVYAHETGKLEVLNLKSRLAFELKDLGFEIYTIGTIHDGFCPVGLADKYNSGATIQEYTSSKGTHRVTLMDGGSFVAYAAERPKSVMVDGQAVEFAYDSKYCRLTVDLPRGSSISLEIK